MKNVNIPRMVGKTFTVLHEVPEIDQFLDKGKEYFSKKYNIDYFSVHMVHHSRSNLISFYAHDQWHEFLYETNQGVHQYTKGVFFRKNALIQKNEFYMEYFDSYHSFSESDQRAEIVGIKKHGGCTLVASDDLNNVTVYDITFKNDSSFGTLDKKILFDLINDLINYRPLLLPFINHADQFGDFTDKHTLHQSMANFTKTHPSLFHF